MPTERPSRRSIGTGSVASRPPRSRRWAGAAVIVLLGGLAATACSRDTAAPAPPGGTAIASTSAPAPGATRPSTGGARRVQFRPVLATLPPTGTPTGTGAPAPAAPDPSVETVLPELDGQGAEVERLRVGPTDVLGDAFTSARTMKSDWGPGLWIIRPTFRAGRPGIDTFNDLAAHCFATDSTCPSGRIAIVVDGVVISAPTIRAQRFEADQIEISGSFTEEGAAQVALVLNAAATT